MLRLYPTNETFSKEGICKDAPVLRNVDGKCYILLKRERKSNVVYPVIDSKTDKLSIHCDRVNDCMSGHQETNFIVLSVKYEDLLIDAWDWSNCENHNEERTPTEKRLLLLLLASQKLQNKCAKEFDLLFANYRALKDQIEKLERRLSALEEPPAEKVAEKVYDEEWHE